MKSTVNARSTLDRCVLQLRLLEHHVEEIACIAQIVIRIRIMHADTDVDKRMPLSLALSQSAGRSVYTQCRRRRCFGVRIEG